MSRSTMKIRQSIRGDRDETEIWKWIRNFEKRGSRSKDVTGDPAAR